MPLELSNYYVLCLSEGIKVLSDYRSSPPIFCPNDTNHKIDEKIVKYKTIATNKTDIIDNYYQTKTFAYDIDNTLPIYTNTMSWPCDIIISNITVFFSKLSIGDSFDLVISPNKIIGYLDSEIRDKKELKVNKELLQYVKRGFEISISNYEIINDLGRITNIDEINCIIAFEYELSNDFKIGSPITLNYKMITDFHIEYCVVSPFGINIGITSKVLQANTDLELLYRNLNSKNLKKILFKIDYTIIV
jgi:hypothetical protein